MNTETTGCFINGEWTSGTGEELRSYNPADGSLVWQGASAAAVEISNAMQAAQTAFSIWAQFAVEQRFAILQTYAAQLKTELEDFATLISQENGKPLWEARAEVTAMINKVTISYQAYKERCAAQQQTADNSERIIRYQPQGVVAVLGPFNFPGHLPNGHIVPALLAGNTVVFKPSEWTPAVAIRMMELLAASGLPAGVVNMVIGGRATGEALLARDDLAGVFFTGSATAGQAIHRRFAGHPQTILALEMGGNNPLILDTVADQRAALYHVLMSAFVTSGQRCTCARRLIIVESATTADFLNRLVKAASQLRLGPGNGQPAPFMGPLISAQAVEQAMARSQELAIAGGQWLLPLKPDGAYLAPGIMDVTAISDRPDQEIFAPFLQIIRVKDFSTALEEANATRFGLSAGLLCDDPETYRRFAARIRAGIVNWNCPTTGASSAAPFGGVGLSGNHRPSAYFAADYCAYPVAAHNQPKLVLPEQSPAGFPDLKTL